MTSAAPSPTVSEATGPSAPAPAVDDEGLVGRLVAALPEAEQPSHGLRIHTDCSDVTSQCVDFVGLGVSAVSDEPTDPAHFRIAIYPTSAAESATDPQWAFDGAQERCRPGPFDHQPNLDPRGIQMPNARLGERGTTTTLTWELPGWQTVSCLRDVTTYTVAPPTGTPEPAEDSPGWVDEPGDVGESTTAYSAALGRTETGEPLLVIVSASDVDLLAEVRDAYLTAAGVGGGAER